MYSFNDLIVIFFNFKPMKFFSLYGFIAILAIALPSLIFMKKAHKTRPDDLDVYSIRTARVELVCRTLLNFTLPLMRMPEFETVFLYIAIGALGVYYLLWIRFAIQGSYYPDIYMKTLFGIPIPFDICNVIFFISISIYLTNLFSLSLSIIYGAARILNATKARKDLNSRVEA